MVRRIKAQCNDESDGVQHLEVVVSVARKTEGSMWPELLLYIQIRGPFSLVCWAVMATMVRRIKAQCNDESDGVQHREVVVSVARKTDASMWPALFAAAGDPGELLKGLTRQGALQSAACSLLIVDRLQGPDMAQTLALQLLQVPTLSIFPGLPPPPLHPPTPQTLPQPCLSSAICLPASVYLRMHIWHLAKPSLIWVESMMTLNNDEADMAQTLALQLSQVPTLFFAQPNNPPPPLP